MDVEKLVNEIFTIVNRLSETEIDTLSGDTLSRLAVKLASYKASLGEHVAAAERLALDGEAKYKIAKSEEYKRLREEGKGATDAKELMRLGATAQYEEWNKAREQALLIKTLNNNCHDLIHGIKSRLINLQQEKGESNVY